MNPLLQGFHDFPESCVVAYGAPATLRRYALPTVTSPRSSRFTLHPTSYVDVPLQTSWKQPTALACSGNGTDVAVTYSSGVTSVHRMTPAAAELNEPLIVNKFADEARGSALSWSVKQPSSILVGYSITAGKTFSSGSVEHVDVTTGTFQCVDVSRSSVTALAHVPSSLHEFIMCTARESVMICDLRSPGSGLSMHSQDKGIYCLTFHPTHQQMFVTCTYPREENHTEVSYFYFWDVRQTGSPVSTVDFKSSKVVSQLLWGKTSNTLFAVCEDDTYLNIVSVDISMDQTINVDMGYESFATDGSGKSSGSKRQTVRRHVPRKKGTSGLIGLRTVQVENAESIYGITWFGSKLAVLDSQRGTIQLLEIPDAPPVCSWKGGPISTLRVMRGNVLREIPMGKTALGYRVRNRIEKGFCLNPTVNANICAGTKDWNGVVVLHWLSHMLSHSAAFTAVPDSHFLGLAAVLSDNAFGVSELHRRHFVLQLCRWEDPEGLLSTSKEGPPNLLQRQRSNSTNTPSAWPNQMLSEDELLERRVFISVIQGKNRDALELLYNKTENQYVLLAALISSGAKPTTSNTSGLSRYVAALLRYSMLTPGMSSSVLLEHFTALPLYDRIGLAVTCISDTATLCTHLQKLTEESIRVSPLLGVLFSGLTTEGATAIQDYINVSSDVQLAIAVSAYASRRYPEKFFIWQTAYRDWCNVSQQYNHRARFDIEVLRIQQMTGDIGLIGGAKPSSQRRKAPTTIVRCSHCGQQLQHSAPITQSPQPFSGLKGPGGAPGTCATSVRVRSQCPNPVCRKPLPSCGVCRMTMDTPAAANPPVEHQSWFLWCARCQHGGHAAHVLKWFATNSTCPVEPCQCECALAL